MESKIEQFSLIGFWLGLNLGIYALGIYVKNNVNLAFFCFFLVFLSIIFRVDPVFLSIVFLLFYSYSIRSSYQL